MLFIVLPLFTFQIFFGKCYTYKMVAKVRSLRSPGISSQQQSIKRLVGTIRSSLLQKIIFKDTKTLQLFTILKEVVKGY